MSRKPVVASARAKGIRTVVSIAIILVAAVIMTHFLPSDPALFGPISLIPAIFLIAYIFATKRVVEGLVLASLIGVIMVARPVTVEEGTWIGNTFSIFSDSILGVMMEENTAWLIIVCGLMGSIIALIEKTGGAFAFGRWTAKHAKSRKSSLIWTWILGVIIFIDDYLNSLTVGACMSKLTDEHKVPREFLSYVVDSTAAPVCVLIPISTWAVFVGNLLEQNGWAPAGEGLDYFIKTIKYDYYGWIATIIVPLAILGGILAIGPMKKAFQRVKDGGPLAPPDSEKIDIHGGQEVEIPEKCSIWNMLIPILVLIISTILTGSDVKGIINAIATGAPIPAGAFGTDMQLGVIITLGFMFAFYLIQGLMTAEEFVDISIEGFKSMILPLLLMVLAFLFAAVNDKIHFTEYVINTGASLVTPKFLPLVVFIMLSITEFITGTNWGMYIIALPIVIPLAQRMGVNVALAVSAVLSAGVFGSHICFYSDATVITSSACGCDNMRHAVTQLPYGLLAAVLSAVCFIIAGVLPIHWLVVLLIGAVLTVVTMFALKKFQGAKFDEE